MAARLNGNEIAEALAAQPGWILAEDGRSIRKSFRFADFSEALAYMVRVGLAAEAMDHHPDWANSYNRVEVSLTTHSAGGLTARDFSLAARMDSLAKA